MTQIYCEYTDCINNEDQLCHAAAIRLSTSDCCLTFQTHENGKKKTEKQKGDKLIWDREFFEDDPIDDEAVF